LSSARWLILLAAAGAAVAVPWPVEPVDQPHPLGNYWGEYQNYGGDPYFHPGIDVITPDTFNVAVHAVQHGWVKAWGTTQADLHYRLAICDTNSQFTGRAAGWLYAHIDADQPHKQVGDEVQVGDIIGELVDWPLDASFDHCHFARISDTGATWQRFPEPTWWFIQNPLTLMDQHEDLAAPVFQNARSGARFAFCRNNTSTYQQPTNISGDVDIVARIYDKTGYSTGDSTWDKMTPYQVEYMIRSAGGTVVVPWTLSLQFSNYLPWDDVSCVDVVYKSDNTCQTYGDYDMREYYFIVTNTDGDSLIETTDASGTWQSGLTGDGSYWVFVRASDVFGNTTTDSMQVTTNNGVAVAERIQPVLSRPLELTPAVTAGPVLVSFSLSQPTQCHLLVVDALGRVIRELADGRLGAGNHNVTAAVTDNGVYLVELVLDNGDRYSRKLVVAR
jgi:hypothetical protein